MAKRFIDSNIFRKGFLKMMPTQLKLFYVYLFCECDHCGIWNVEFDVAKIRLGIDIDEQDTLKLFGNKVISFDDGNKWFIPQFILFQYGELNGTNKLHLSVKRELHKHKLMTYLLDENDHESDRVSSDLSQGKNTLKDKVKDKDTDKVKDKEIGRKSTENQNNKRTNKQNLVNLAHISSTINQNEPIDDIHKEEDLSSLETFKSSNKKLNAEQFKSFICMYSEFLKLKGIPIRITQADGKAMKLIIKYISDIDNIKNGTKPAIDVWKYILDNWHLQSDWMQTQIQLRQINSQLPNIIEHLKNGKRKPSANDRQQLSDLAKTLRNAVEGG